MKLTSVAAVLTLLLAACTPYLGERTAMKSSTSPGARDRYESDVLGSRLGKSAAYAAWSDEARRALRAGLAIRPSFREIVHFDADQATAMGYRLELRRGQKLRVRIERASYEGRLFVELFEEIAAREPIFRLVESAAPHATELTFEAHMDGTHVLRLQPELAAHGKVTVTLTTAAGLKFPVLGKTSRAIGSVFGDPRDGGRRAHEGIDIFAPRGTEVLAVADGVITNVATTNIGGLVVWQYDAERQVHYYYAHLNNQKVRSGEHVQAGAVLGTVGNTGNARTTPPHLHFAVYRPGRVAIDPVPFIFDAPGDIVAPVMVDLARLGRWTSTTKAVSLRSAPAHAASILAELPQRTRMQIVSGVRDWHRIRLQDGRTGFIPGEANLLGMK